MKPPRTSFTAALKDVEPPKDYLTQENRMKWYTAVIKAFNPVVDVAVDAVKKIGKRTKDDLEEVTEDFVDSVRSTIDVARGDFSFISILERITGDYIANASAEDIEYLNSTLPVISELALKAQCNAAQGAMYIYSRKIKPELTAEQIEEILDTIERMRAENARI